MRCLECGAELPGEESCEDRFHALLATEWEQPETAEMHALFILAYHAQHPSLCKPWLRAAYKDTLREIYGEGKAWRKVLASPKDRTRRQEAVDRAKERYANAPGTPVVGKPVESEMTIADVPAPNSACYPSEYPGKVESWARSVAENRML